MSHARTARALHGERDAEVGDQCVSALQQDVLWLDVAVDHAAPVGVCECVRHLARDQHRFRNRQQPHAREARAQRLAIDERHDVEQEATRFARVVQRQDVRVLQVGRRANLGEKALGTERGGEIRVQHLDCDIAIVLEIVREIHGGHAADTEFAVNAIAVGECGGELIGWHGRISSHCTGWLVITTYSPSDHPQPLLPGQDVHVAHAFGLFPKIPHHASMRLAVVVGEPFQSP